MSKVYFCTKLTFGGFQCGETDPEKFPKGRYSECKECKNRYSRDYFHNRRNEEINNKVEKIDPKQEIRTVVENTILQSPLIKGISVEKSITRLEENVSEILVSFSEKIDILNAHIKVILQENQLIRKELEFIKNKRK